MKITSLLRASALVMTAMACSTSVSAQSVPNVITIDENGHGTVSGTFFTTTTLPSSLAPDASLGGITALAYGLPANVVQGDVVLTDNGVPGDLIRFISAMPGTTATSATAFFYSDAEGANGTGDADLADNRLRTPGLPTLLTNNITIAEIGPEGSNGATYTPTANQPGYIAGANVTYHFISDSPVPEPATWAMMLLGFGAIGWTVRARKPRAMLKTV